MNTNSVWVVINCDSASDKLKDNIDHGAFAEANALNFQLNAMSEQLKSLISAKGGTVHISIPDRIILSAPITVVEEIPNILAGYKDFFGTQMAVGIGMDLLEASKAAKKSDRTNDIEMYDPTDESFKKDEDEDLMLPPNLFDPLVPKQTERPQDAEYVPVPDVEQQMQTEAQYLQAIIQQMGGGQQQPDPAQQAQQQPPRDLLEALHGQQIPGREDPNAKEASDKGPKKDNKETDSGDKSSKKDDSDEEDTDDSNEHLASMLSNIKTQIPQLIKLHETNPKAFKQSLDLIHKLLALTKDKQSKKTNKSEGSELFGVLEELNKKLAFPVGTRKGRKIKVMVNGKATWRSVASGQLRDGQGNPISVRTSNEQAAQANKGNVEGVKE